MSGSLRESRLGEPVATRRSFLRQTGGGFGAVAAAWLLEQEPARAAAPLSPMAPRPSHFPAKATRVIYLFMHGGPSHLETFDPKPELQRLAGQPLPPSFGHVATRRQVAANPLLGTKRTFRPAGRSGLPVSNFLPHIAECADELAVIRSCRADSVNHPQAVYQMNTGSVLMGKPSLGSWVGYRTRDGEPGPARLRGAARSGWRYQGRSACLRCRLLAGESSGYGHAVGFAAHSRPGTSRWDVRHRPAPDARPDRQAERPPSRRAGRRHRARCSHPGVRAGLPDAIRRSRRRRPGH